MGEPSPRSPEGADHEALLGDLDRSRLRPWSRLSAGRRATVKKRHEVATHPLFAVCTAKEVRTLARWGDAVSVPGGVELLREDGVGTCFVVVVSGQLRVTKAGCDIATIPAGGWIGEVAILGFGPQPATVTTATDCRLFVLGRRPLLSFAVGLPGLRRGLFPGLTVAETLEKIRGLRHEGLAAWPRTVPADEREERPAWLRIYPARQSLLGTPRRSSAADDPVSTPGRRARRSPGWSVVLAIAACCTVAIAALPVPYYSFHGEIRSATGIVGVVGRPVYPAHGLVLFPIVVSRHDRAAVAIRDWAAGADLRSRHQVFGDESPSESNRASRSLMDEAKRDASVVAFRLAGAGAPPTRGVILDTGHLGGPSAGLAFSLALVDLLTPGELTGLRTVAATGAVTADGAVEAVGGIRLKTIAARKAGADVFLVPKANYTEAVANAGHMRVIPVDTVAGAVAALAAR